jgi:hypothetical protein
MCPVLMSLCVLIWACLGGGDPGEAGGAQVTVLREPGEVFEHLAVALLHPFRLVSSDLIGNLMIHRL